MPSGRTRWMGRIDRDVVSEDRGDHLVRHDLSQDAPIEDGRVDVAAVLVRDVEVQRCCPRSVTRSSVASCRRGGSGRTRRPVSRSPTRRNVKICLFMPNGPSVVAIHVPTMSQCGSASNGTGCQCGARGAGEAPPPPPARRVLGYMVGVPGGSSCAGSPPGSGLARVLDERQPLPITAGGAPRYRQAPIGEHRALLVDGLDAAIRIGDGDGEGDAGPFSSTSRR